MGSNLRSSVNATLNASTRIRSRVACAVRYFCVARRRRRRSSRDRPTRSDGFRPQSIPFIVLSPISWLVDVAVAARRRGIFECTIGIFSQARPVFM